MAWMRFRKKEMPEGLWTKCDVCKEMLFKKELDAAFKVCKKCGHHFRMSATERIESILDPGSFEEVAADLEAVDSLSFVAKGQAYPAKLKEEQKKTGRRDALVIGTGRLRGRELVFGAMEFEFLGGSMGVVVGHKVLLAAELALARRQPLFIVCASGGARMHEGALSLMQMAKACAALARLSQAGGLYVSLLTDPTTGGVTASFATMADVVLAEPHSLIGFAGPRVIEQTIKQKLPKDFQRAEFLIQKGQLDAIVPRPELVPTLDRLFTLLLAPVEPQPAATLSGAALASPTPNGRRDEPSAPPDLPTSRESPARRP
jgi:acetyl-CoA carboxylase carboxyl transferase subunit beta